MEEKCEKHGYMLCPHCADIKPKERPDRTELIKNPEPTRYKTFGANRHYF